jgi:ABC-type glycerol-3-phosphate transport system substrate-binding protein
VTERAFRWYLNWVQRDSIVPRVFTLRRSLGDQLRLFNSGKVAMLVTGHFWIPQLRPYAEQGRIALGFAAIPHRSGVPPVTVVYASGWAVPATVPRRRLAVELAAFMADSFAQRTRAERGLEISALTPVASEVATADTTGWERVFEESMRTARPPWGSRVRGWREVENRLPQVIDEVLLGGRDLHAALHAAAQDIDTLLAEAGR